MKRLVQVFLLLVSASEGLAQGTFRVVPSAQANVEGNSSSADLFTTSARQMTQVYSASEFGFSPGASGLVTSVAFRFDGSTAQSFNGLWPFLGITLSTTTQSPDLLSPIFVNNGGADSVQVFAGSFFIRGTNTGIFPRTFEVQIPFSTPFWYDPSRGNLSMYISSPFSGPAGLILDAHDSPGDAIGRVFGPDGQVSGTVDTLGLITRFGITEVPEPGAGMLLILGLFTAAALSRRRRA